METIKEDPKNQGSRENKGEYGRRCWLDIEAMWAVPRPRGTYLLVSPTMCYLASSSPESPQNIFTQQIFIKHRPSFRACVRDKENNGEIEIDMGSAFTSLLLS